MAVPNHHRPEPLAIPFGVCPVDARDDPGSAVGRTSTEIKPGEHWAAAEKAGIELSAAVFASHRAGSGTGSAVAPKGVSWHSPAGPAGRSRNLFWRRSGSAVGLSCRNDLGHQGPDARGAAHGATQFAEHDLGGERRRPSTLHGGKRQRQRSSLCRVPEALDAQRRPAYLSHSRWWQLSSEPASTRLRGQPGRSPASVLSAALLARTEPGRAGVELRQTSRRSQGGTSWPPGTQDVRPGPPSVTAAVTLDHPYVFSHSGYPIRSPLIPPTLPHVYLLMSALITAQLTGPPASRRDRSRISVWIAFHLCLRLGATRTLVGNES